MSPKPTAEAPTTLLSTAQVERRVQELADEIARDYADCEELVCLGVLKGSVVFLVDLTRRLPLPVRMDFYQTSSYGSSTTPGEVVVKQDVELPLAGRDVLIVEDIVDTGNTLNTILSMLRLRQPRSLKLCALLSKPSRREVAVPIDYLGFEIEDRFVVGYGLDFDERWRNLPYVGVLDE